MITTDTPGGSAVGAEKGGGSAAVPPGNGGSQSTPKTVRRQSGDVRQPLNAARRRGRGGRCNSSDCRGASYDGNRATDTIADAVADHVHSHHQTERQHRMMMPFGPAGGSGCDDA